MAVRFSLAKYGLVCLLGILGLGCSNENEEPLGARSTWKLLWEDNFEGAKGQALDSRRWGFDVGGNGWGNGQLEFNTDKTNNAALDGDGYLDITAREETYGNNLYTSARILTRGRFHRAYGRFEARIKLPVGQGIWPAFWLLGNDIDEVGWPTCGEIDVMEYRGQEPWKIAGSLHGPGYSGGTPVSESYVLPGKSDFNEDFHIFRIDWSPERITWFVDDFLYQVVELSGLPGPSVFDHPFFMILNVAVGGAYVGPPDTTTVFPQTMKVDFVRVYEAE
jgi:beta-glucanase (GH16 family)